MSFHAVVPRPAPSSPGAETAPATVRVYEPDGTRREHRYWDAPFARAADRKGWTETDWEDALAEALAIAVRRRMVSDVPVGVLLSGGLDSSLVVALLAQQGQTGLSTFSIGFESVGGREVTSSSTRT